MTAFPQLSSQQQRGSLSVLSVLWCAVTLIGVWIIAGATSVVQQRAFAQESADSLALAATVGGPSAASALKDILNVTVTQLEITDNGVLVEVRVGRFTATSEASRGS